MVGVSLHVLAGDRFPFPLFARLVGIAASPWDSRTPSPTPPHNLKVVTRHSLAACVHPVSGSQHFHSYSFAAGRWMTLRACLPGACFWSRSGDSRGSKMAVATKVVDVPSADGFDEAMEKLAEVPNVYVVFLADKDRSTGQSWCPDCRKAEPVIDKCFAEAAAEKERVLVRCYVGDGPTWRNPQHPFRTDSRLKLTGVPTLVRWEKGAVVRSLGDVDSANRKLVLDLIA
ncbi:hypothetical protein CBR_g40140 [Chara braunii]|uniref:Thioredoxin domain-containing protein n=1 Tax=Chara braunii TaxID=69332 RepID=A0A388LTA7_CHABU|nr:hypothetical protein CBR_g40140 [Chara braunii]|eukprot:GBG85501.1 hypothetical protein CBR_g40140 [Chara braunii]